MAQCLVVFVLENQRSLFTMTNMQLLDDLPAELVKPLVRMMQLLEFRQFPEQFGFNTAQPHAQLANSALSDQYPLDRFTYAALHMMPEPVFP